MIALKQTLLRINSFVLLTMLMASGLFVFSAQDAAAASMSQMQDVSTVSMGEKLICDQGGCAKKHNDCLKHCLQKTEDENKAPALTNNQNYPELEFIVTAHKFSQQVIQVPKTLRVSDRASPILEHLRSVIKLE